MILNKPLNKTSWQYCYFHFSVIWDFSRNIIAFFEICLWCDTTRDIKKCNKINNILARTSEIGKNVLKRILKIKDKIQKQSPEVFYVKKSLWHRCLPVNFANFLRTPFLTEHLCWLLQKIKWLPLQLKVTGFYKRELFIYWTICSLMIENWPKVTLF